MAACLAVRIEKQRHERLRDQRLCGPSNAAVMQRSSKPPTVMMTRITIRKADGSTWSDDLVPESMTPAGELLPLDSLPRITAKTFNAVGSCVYCGAGQGELTREHIVPLGLGGTFVLPASSCKRC